MNLTLKTNISRVMMLIMMIMVTIMTSTILILVTLGPKRRWEDNTKMDLQVRG